MLTQEQVINSVLRERYFALGDKSKEDVYQRAAYSVNAPNAETIYKLMVDNVFLPNTPTLANAGTSHGTLSACFVIPIEDSLEGFYRAAREMGIVHKNFGGTGFFFGGIRPRGSVVRSTGGKACGPVEVLRLLNQNAEMVRQGGKRHGANMGILNIDHGDIAEWINCKDSGGLSHFNLSVSVTNAFMTHRDEKFDLICEHAWRSGDPGLLFIDTVNRDQPRGWKPINATNPCGEQPLGDYESCNLGSINLGSFASDPGCAVTDQGFDIGSFRWTVDQAVRYLDSIIDSNKYPLPEIEAATKNTRKIGLGVMGWADCLIKLNVPWCSQQALDLIDHIGEALYTQARVTSEELARDFSPFPAYDERWFDYPPRRNATLTTIAPTGTLSKLANCSSGIEPIYDWEYDIFTEQGTYHYRYPYTSLPCENDIAHKIPYSWHIKHQAQWQKWIDNAVSKTINLPADATVEDVRDAYVLAWELGCKGITIYRDRSKDEQVLTTSKSLKSGFTRRPGAIYEVQSGCGKLRVILGATDDAYTDLFEGYVITAGGCTANNEAIGRSISLEMQKHIEVEEITGTLHKVRCVNAMRNPQSAGKSCADIIATCIDIETKEFIHKESSRETLDSCPACKATLQHIEGCGTGTCPVCGWSGCS